MTAYPRKTLITMSHQHGQGRSTTSSRGSTTSIGQGFKRLFQFGTSTSNCAYCGEEIAKDQPESRSDGGKCFHERYDLIAISVQLK